MSKEIDVACPGCQAIFRVPVEFCGETAECEVCGSLFEIPHQHPQSNTKGSSTDTGPIQGVESGNVAEGTNTVKLSRSGIGMIPDIQDNFSFGSELPAKSIKRTPEPPKKKTRTSNKTRKAKVIIPSWTNIRLESGEEAIDYSESISSTWKNPILIIAPVAFNGLVGALIAHYSSLTVALINIFFISVIIFIVAKIIDKENFRKALIVTTKRSVAIFGKLKLTARH